MQTREGRELAYACYYDWDIVHACLRFERSDEWQAVKSILKTVSLPGCEALDLGAGNGIGSYALAKLGFRVVAVEPDPSNLVGFGALLNMVESTKLPIRHVRALGEELPFRRARYSLVYSRQVLHHARDLPRMLSEVSRVLRYGGLLIASREHVVDDEDTLLKFLSSHPIHRFTGGESAFRLDEYLEAISFAGLTLKMMLTPWASIINYYPVSKMLLMEEMKEYALDRWGKLGQLMLLSPSWRRRYAARKSAKDQTPGRMFTFVAVADSVQNT